MATARARTYPDPGYEGETEGRGRVPPAARITSQAMDMHMSSPSIQREPGSVRTNASQSIGFRARAHRFDLLALPLLVGLAAIVLLIAAAFGITRIKVDDSLSQLFRIRNAGVQNLRSGDARFPSNEFDVLIVVEGKNLLEARFDRKLRVWSPTFS